MAFYSAKDAEQSVKLIPSGWLGALPRRATKTNRLISVISFYGKNEGLGSIPDLEAGAAYSISIFVSLQFRNSTAVVQLTVNQ